MAIATVLGFTHRKRARQVRAGAFTGKGKCESGLLQTAADLRAAQWKTLKDAGMAHIPCNDFSLYDHVLDMSALFGTVPERYQWRGGTVDLPAYFAMARGAQKEGIDVSAMEMTKWFDTNYHYIVPEFSAKQDFRVSWNKPVDEFNEAKAQGIPARPVLIGPVTYLLLGKRIDGGSTVELLDRLLPAYVDVLRKLEEAGAGWVQLDEPALATDLDVSIQNAYTRAYSYLRESSKLKLFVASYFGSLGANAETAIQLPVDALHIDLVRDAEQMDAVLEDFSSSMILSLGVVDGRNIWRNNLEV